MDSSTPSSFPLLPNLKTDLTLEPIEKKGEWKKYSKLDFDKVAESLDYAAPGENKKINSVPSVWALPMTLEIPLFNNKHPLRDDAVDQWRGMLAAIAFAETRNFPLKVQYLNLNEDNEKGEEFRKRQPFADALYQLMPDRNKSLYQLDRKSPWDEIFIWMWNNKPVGITSPNTIVVPVAKAEWTGLDWWSSTNGKLGFTPDHLKKGEPNQFLSWLTNLQEEVNDKQNLHKGNKNTKENIAKLLSEFIDELKCPAFDGDIRGQEFSPYMNRGVLAALNRPIKPLVIDWENSFVRVLGSRTSDKAMLLIDPEIIKVSGKAPQEIQVYKDKTLANLNIDDLRAGRINGWDEVECYEPQDLFLPELTFINKNNALPGAMTIQSEQPLMFNGIRITPLIPLNPVLLNYFTSEDLNNKIYFSQNGKVVEVTLSLPLSGMKKAGDPRSEGLYKISKKYTLNEDCIIATLPVLEIWPWIQAPGWKEYYAFYYDANNSFKVNFREAEVPHDFRENAADYLVTKLSSFPSHINCHQKGYPIGLIILQSPPRTEELSGKWKVGVDFGTSFTNIYVNCKDVVNPLEIKSLHLRVTGGDNRSRDDILFQNFIPNEFLPVKNPLPLASIITQKGKTTSVGVNKKVIYDGRIFSPNFSDFQPKLDWIETNLKWTSPDQLNRLFLENVGLLVSALAASSRIGEIDWFVSYPSAFSPGDTEAYAQIWKNLTDKLRKSTGISHLCPKLGTNTFRTESISLAQYFDVQEKSNLTSSVCIDLGGGTSDISVWQDKTLIHQCSVQLAGKHLLSYFLKRRPDLITRWFKGTKDEWENLPEEKFNAKLDCLLRYKSDGWLQEERMFLRDDNDFQGLIQLMALGTAGLYYYIGLILNVLKKEGKYTEDDIPSIYVGGNGSRLLNWFAPSGTFSNSLKVNDLLNEMIASASGLQMSSSNTQLSKKPKDEAACGLVVEGTTLTIFDGLDPWISGETCSINGVITNFDQRMILERKKFKVEAPQNFSKLLDFVNSFNEKIIDLRAEEYITPLSQYRKGNGLDDTYAKSLFSKTNKEMRSMLDEINKESDPRKVRIEPPFILGLKALLRILTKEWAER